MSSPVACVGHRFTGVCHACDNHTVSGTLISGEFVTIDGKNVCVTGSQGKGDCGHTCTVIGGSTVWTIEGKAVARVGDSVTGTIEGTIISGSDTVSSD